MITDLHMYIKKVSIFQFCLFTAALGDLKLKYLKNDCLNDLV